jgi:hypothetical protein
MISIRDVLFKVYYFVLGTFLSGTIIITIYFLLWIGESFNLVSSPDLDDYIFVVPSLIVLTVGCIIWSAFHTWRKKPLIKYNWIVGGIIWSIGVPFVWSAIWIGNFTLYTPLWYEFSPYFIMGVLLSVAVKLYSSNKIKSSILTLILCYIFAHYPTWGMHAGFSGDHGHILWNTGLNHLH